MLDPVEVDETHFGGKWHNMPKHKGSTRRPWDPRYRMLRYRQDYIDVGGESEVQFRLRRLAALNHVGKSLGFNLVPSSKSS